MQGIISYSYSYPSDLPQQLDMIGLESPLPFCYPANLHFRAVLGIETV